MGSKLGPHIGSTVRFLTPDLLKSWSLEIWTYRFLGVLKFDWLLHETPDKSQSDRVIKKTNPAISRFHEILLFGLWLALCPPDAHCPCQAGGGGPEKQGGRLGSTGGLLWGKPRKPHNTHSVLSHGLITCPVLWINGFLAGKSVYGRARPVLKAAAHRIEHACLWTGLSCYEPGSCLSIKMLPYQDRNSHYKLKTVWRPSQVNNPR